VSHRASSFVAASSAGASPGSKGVYDDPRTYELAFGFREFDKEAAFLASLSKRLGTGRDPASLLELGAGPAWHSTAVASLCPGAVAVAVDNSPAMLERARERVTECALNERVAVVDGDMTKLDAKKCVERAFEMAPRESKQAVARGFDVACVLLGTAAHLVHTEDAIACLRAIHDALAPGGVAVLELEHPYDLFEGQLMDAQGDAWDREDASSGVKVLVEWGREGDAFDVQTHVVERTVGFNVLDLATNEPANGYEAVEQVVRCRVFTAPEVDALARLAGMRVCATFGDMDERVPLDSEEAHNMLVVLKKDHQ